ncbi:hypothetical protein [Burkholderia multivorans]|uniref:hypothetical protein n=1 Tax=Burkholderia multivorans TaxID=87883 RepID=UPI000CFF7D17|nr:hypothetical protein [Burkholderia multivorans]PRH17235.1 hypothetical protein C6T53_26015 [Burkholderia multivorans]
MANNNFKPFAAAAGANVMAQADYEALAALLTGFQSGTAQSAQLNKVWRQSSIMAAVLGQFIVDLTGQDAVDDGTTATLLANLKMAVQAQSAAVVGQARNLSMSVTTAASTATLNADEIVVGTALGGQKYLLKQFSKTINLATTGAGGMDTGSAPVSGFVGIYAIYNPTTGASALLATNATAAKVPEVYAGGQMPSGYTASALVSVWPTNGSSQFMIGTQIDRRISFVGINALSGNANIGSLTSLSIASIVPKNAKSIRGWIGISSAGVSTALAISVASSSSAIGLIYTQGNNTQTVNASFGDIDISTPQTIYYSNQCTGSTISSQSIQIAGYSF